MIAVVVVTYSATPTQLDATLASVLATAPDAALIVVDTGGQAVIDRPEVELIAMDNRGYGAAANTGFARALARGATRCALLNDDVIVQTGWLAALDAELGDDVGATQPKLLVAGTGRINSLGVALDRCGAGVDIGYDQPDTTNETDNTDASSLGARDIDIFTGGAVLFSAAFLDATGGFDERFMLYYEDVDLALRGQELGWRYRLVPTAVVEHVGGATTASQPALTRYLQERNRLWNAARFTDPATTARALWLSVRRLRHAPRPVHRRALVHGLAGMPRAYRERFAARRRVRRTAAR